MPILVTLVVVLSGLLVREHIKRRKAESQPRGLPAVPAPVPSAPGSGVSNPAIEPSKGPVYAVIDEKAGDVDWGYVEVGKSESEVAIPHPSAAAAARYETAVTKNPA